MSRPPAAEAKGLQILDSLPRFAVSGAEALKPGFERISALLRHLGNPHLDYPIVHVAGTNGKGSTASMIAAAATVAGYRTGLHTSPHLVDVGERMRIDGHPAPGSWIDEGVLNLADLIGSVGPSYFEVTVALAFRRFAEQAVDLAVIEVGLGGRLDATNVVTPIVSVITDVAMDHASILGDTVTAIAREKAGIIKPGIPVVVSDSGSDVTEVLRTTAREVGAPIEVVRAEGRSRLLDLPGEHQQRNAAVALAALTHVRPRFPRLTAEAVDRGLAEAAAISGLRGRFETVGHRPWIVADVAHNPDGLATALRLFGEPGRTNSVDRHDPEGGTAYVCLSVMRDKDFRAMARQLADAGVCVVPVGLPTDRALTPAEMSPVLRAEGCRTLDALSSPADVYPWIRSHALPADRVLVAGSFQLTGPFLHAWDAPATR